MNHRSTSSPQPIVLLPCWAAQLGSILLGFTCALPLAGQELRQPPRNGIEVIVGDRLLVEQKRRQLPRRLAFGEVRFSISLRGEANELRFVPAARVVEEGELPSIPPEPPAEIVQYFESLAEQQIADIDRACQLDERQQAKLKLAAVGDMSRFAREAREVQEKYFGLAMHNQRDVRASVADIGMLNLHLSEGVLRKGSMFLMVLKSQLNPEQSERLARERFDKICKVWLVHLSESEREQLWTLVQRINEQSDEQPMLWTYDHCRKLVDKLPREELAGFLDASQIDAVDGWCNP